MKEWDTDRPLNGKGKPMSVRDFAVLKGIPKSTLGDYICTDKSKRKQVGASVGQPTLLSEHQTKVLVQCALKADRSNEGMTPAQLEANIQKLNPELTAEQDKNHCRTFMKKNEGVVNPKAVKAQKTTSCRSQCTVAQQFCWR